MLLIKSIFEIVTTFPVCQNAPNTTTGLPDTGISVVIYKLANGNTWNNQPTATINHKLLTNGNNYLFSSKVIGIHSKVNLPKIKTLHAINNCSFVLKAFQGFQNINSGVILKRIKICSNRDGSLVFEPFFARGRNKNQIFTANKINWRFSYFPITDVSISLLTFNFSAETAHAWSSLASTSLFLIFF